MALTNRVTLRRTTGGPNQDEAEDLLGESLATIFPDDVTAQHGDGHHLGIVYTSPHLPHALELALAEPETLDDRNLQSHYLWNSSLLLAELIEAGSLGLPLTVGTPSDEEKHDRVVAHHDRRKQQASIMRREPTFSVSHFDVRGLRTLELGAGTALPSILASLLGARDVVATDFPSATVLRTLRRNITANCSDVRLSPRRTLAPTTVVGHAWGKVDDDDDDDDGFAQSHRGAFDRILVCDCLWMPWQHYNLHRSIAHFLAPPSSDTAQSSDSEPRAWVVGAFHTGRAQMRGFFDREGLAQHGLEVERIWERDCDGAERTWVEDRGVEDVTLHKRWLAFGILRWKKTPP